MPLVDLLSYGRANCPTSQYTQFWTITADKNCYSTYVMAVLNATPMNQSVTVSMYDFFIDNNRTYAGSSFNLLDLWQNSSLYQNVTGSFSVQVPTHGVRLFKVVKA